MITVEKLENALNKIEDKKTRVAICIGDSIVNASELFEMEAGGIIYLCIEGQEIKVVEDADNPGTYTLAVKSCDTCKNKGYYKFCDNLNIRYCSQWNKE